MTTAPQRRTRPSGVPAATATPTAVGDRPLVEVVGDGGGQQRALALDLAADTSHDASIVISQEIARDQQSTRVPPITVPFTVAVTGADRRRAEHHPDLRRADRSTPPG